MLCNSQYCIRLYHSRAMVPVIKPICNVAVVLVVNGHV